MKASFKNHFVFFNLSAEAVDNLMQSMFYCTVKEREFIFKQGD
jgi:cGMP-dependent protein kinase